MKTKVILIIFLISATISLNFKKNKNLKAHPTANFGAAASFGAGYTGAPFDNGGTNCSACHGGGAVAFNPTVTLKMLNSSNNEVTSYIEGENYTIQLSIIAATGTPQFGFQVMSVKESDNSNLNTWGTSLQLGTKNTLTGGGRNYIEQNNRLPTGIINIPWIAPAATDGNIVFYAVGNAVNGDGGTSGDVARNASLTITTAPVPITLLSFTGKAEADFVQLQWQTAQEINNDYFAVEHSLDGINFDAVIKIESKGNTSIGHNYLYNHKQAIQGNNYYRLKQVDEDGTYTYSNIVQIKNNAKKVSIFSNPVTNEIILTNVNIDGTIAYKIINVSGKIIANNTLKSNNINVSKLIAGNYFLVISDKSNTSNTIKFTKQ